MSSNFFKIAIPAGFDSTTGSPAIAALDYFYIEFNTNLAADTVASGNINLDYVVVASSDDLLLDVDSGFPSIGKTVAAVAQCRTNTMLTLFHRSITQTHHRDAAHPLGAINFDCDELGVETDCGK